MAQAKISEKDDEKEQRAEAGAISFKGIDGQGAKGGKTGLTDAKISKETTEWLAGLSLAKLKDCLETEITRHERHFEDVTGLACTVVPDLSPRQLHELRLYALTIQRDTKADAIVLRHVVGGLAEVRFVYPVEKAAGGSSPEDAK
jgi:hypothetical protein